jgi:glycerophosphoryl diester phosphodiesterase
VRLARDHVPVVIHDATLKRTGLREGSVALLSSVQLGEADAGTWFNLRRPKAARAEYAEARVPTLREVFELFRKGDSRLYVEMKCDAVENEAFVSTLSMTARSSKASHSIRLR